MDVVVNLPEQERLDGAGEGRRQTANAVRQYGCTGLGAQI